MPDITMCSGEGCKLKDNCYRYTASPNDHQSYFMAPPWNHSDFGCDQYWLEKRDPNPISDGQELWMVGDSCWITIDNLSLSIIRKEKGLLLQVFPFGKENDDSIAERWVFWDEEEF